MCVAFLYVLICCCATLSLSPAPAGGLSFSRETAGTDSTYGQEGHCDWDSARVQVGYCGLCTPGQMGKCGDCTCGPWASVTQGQLGLYAPHGSFLCIAQWVCWVSRSVGRTVPWMLLLFGPSLLGTLINMLPTLTKLDSSALFLQISSYFLMFVPSWSPGM